MISPRDLDTQARATVAAILRAADVDLLDAESFVHVSPASPTGANGHAATLAAPGLPCDGAKLGRDRRTAMATLAGMELAALWVVKARAERAQDGPLPHGPRCAQRFHGAAECDCGASANGPDCACMLCSDAEPTTIGACTSAEHRICSHAGVSCAAECEP